jgi:hypothetical protein
VVRTAWNLYGSLRARCGRSIAGAASGLTCSAILILVSSLQLAALAVATAEPSLLVMASATPPGAEATGQLLDPGRSQVRCSTVLYTDGRAVCLRVFDLATAARNHVDRWVAVAIEARPGQSKFACEAAGHWRSIYRGDVAGLPRSRSSGAGDLVLGGGPPAVATFRIT